MIKFDFSTIPIKLSGKVVNYICPKCKVKFEAPIEMVHEFEEEDMLNGLPASTPPYTICLNVNTINVYQLIINLNVVTTINTKDN